MLEPYSHNKEAGYLLAEFFENYIKVYDICFIRSGSFFGNEFEDFLKNKHKNISDTYEIYKLYEYKFI